MPIKTIIAAGLGVITSVAAAMAQTPSIAPNMDYFYSGTYQGGVSGGNTTRPTGTQGVVGNPNCPQPVEPGGIRPLNWSCPTGTQAVGNNLLAQGVNQNQRGSLLGTATTQQPPPPSARGALLGNAQQTEQQAQIRAQQQAQQQAQMRAQQQAQRQAQRQQAQLRQQMAGNQPYVPSGGAAVNQHLQSAFNGLNGSSRMQLINEAADLMGQRRLEAGPQQSTYGTNYGYGNPARNSNNRGYGQGQFRRY